MACDNVVPANTDTGTEKEERHYNGKMPLWVIEYDLKNEGKGCAVIAACNANEACNILKTGGTFNGTPYKYDIISVLEAYDAFVPMVVVEQNVLNEEAAQHVNNNKTTRRNGK